MVVQVHFRLLLTLLYPFQGVFLPLSHACKKRRIALAPVPYDARGETKSLDSVPPGEEDRRGIGALAASRVSRRSLLPPSASICHRPAPQSRYTVKRDARPGREAAALWPRRRSRRKKYYPSDIAIINSPVTLLVRTWQGMTL